MPHFLYQQQSHQMLKIFIPLFLLTNIFAYKLISLQNSKIVTAPHQQFQNATVLRASSYYQISGSSKVIRTLNVPDVFQATQYTCGPASLTAVLNYFGVDQRQANLAKLAKTNDQNGTDPYDLIDAIKQLGLAGQMIENMSLPQLQDFVRRGLPVILLLQAWKDEDDPTPYPVDREDGHYVVAIGYDGQNIYFEDPWIIGSLGYISKSQLPGRWHGDTLYPRERIIYGCGIVVQQTFKNIPTVRYLQ